VVLSIPDIDAASQAPEPRSTGGGQKRVEEATVESASEMAESVEKFTDKNKFSTLIGWSDRDDIPPPDDK
jgi:hypothetical protein